MQDPEADQSTIEPVADSPHAESNIFAGIVSNSQVAPASATRWIVMGFGLYVASMFLPVAREWIISPDGGAGPGEYRTGFEYWLMSLFSPYIMLQIAVLLPPLVYREQLFAPRQRGLWGMYGIAFVGTLTVPIWNGWELGIGFWCWSASYLALARGFWRLPSRQVCPQTRGPERTT